MPELIRTDSLAILAIVSFSGDIGFGNIIAAAAGHCAFVIFDDVTKMALTMEIPVSNAAAHRGRVLCMFPGLILLRFCIFITAFVLAGRCNCQIIIVFVAIPFQYFIRCGSGFH